MTSAKWAESQQSSRPWHILAGAVLGGGIAAYLSFVAWQHHGLPVGCGDGGGCAEVLRSRWSTVVGLPVSALACALYLGLALAVIFEPRAESRFFLRFAMVTLPAAAVWFIGLQLLWLDAFCPWCNAEHVVGLLLALACAWYLYRTAVPLDSPQTSAPLWLGGLSVLVLATLQSITAPPATTDRLAGDPAAVSGESTKLTLLNGHLIVEPDEPSWGANAADAANTNARPLYLMFDYCCPHCRRTHQYLSAIAAQNPGLFDVVCLPMPRDADCNSDIEQTEPRFNDACELAQLAVAVWMVEPAVFPEYDRWLFQSPKPPNANAAHRHAEQLVDATRLADALSDPRTSARIQRNVNAYNASDAQYLPVLMASGIDPVVGRPESQAALARIIQDELLGTPESNRNIGHQTDAPLPD